MTETSGRLQDLRDFTVQIRNPNTNAIVGTGIAASNDGLIITCVHVVQAALELKRRAQAGDTVGVYFAQARGGETKQRRATVQQIFPEHDDDVALLKLVDGPPPLGPEQIAVLGSAEESEGHEFRSYGYQRLEDYLVGRAEGKILGRVEPPPSRNLQADPVQLLSNQINRGMSGAAVLDTTRNLVVGLVSETWWPDKSQKNSETAWAVDACVLTFDPLNFPLRDTPLPLRPARKPHTDEAAARAAIASQLGVDLSRAPQPLPEWVGRADMLAALDADWREGRVRALGLIGFGGEGKSSLVRKWIDSPLLTGNLRSGEGPGVRPDGVFWWSFYDEPSVDAFFESALKFMSGGGIDPRVIPGANVRAQVIAAMLKARRVIFVLDGFEVMQRNEGDAYGTLQSNDLREFLELFAGTEHHSLCLVTSRLPLLDLISFPAYRHRDVDRLSEADGRALLRELKVKGADSALDGVVREWDGHALTLSLLGSYLVEAHGGDVSRIGDIPPPTAGENRYERVHRVLRRYDEHLTEAQQAFLTLFSAFRIPVKESAFAKVFRAKVEPEKKPGILSRLFGQRSSVETRHAASLLADPRVALDDAAFEKMVKLLLTARLIRYDAAEKAYTTHPLVRAHYFARLSAGDRADTQAAHARIKDYYLALAGDTPKYPTLDDLKPFIEAVHHACQAGVYDEAWRIYLECISQRERYVIVHQLGAYETNLALMLEFFLDADTSQEPQVSDPRNKRFILNAVGFCLERLGEAAPFYERHNAICLGMEDWHNASVGYRNLADLHSHLGALAASADVAGEALALARRAKNKQDEMISLARQAWVAHLRGDMKTAGVVFGQAEALGKEIDSTKRYLYSLPGICHSDHLRRIGDSTHARRVTEANLEICERNRWAFLISQCHRVLGDLDAESNQPGSAREHYNTALKIARSISHRPSLIEALLGRGRFLARFVKDPASARSDLEEALGYAAQDGFRIYEADIHNALAWMHLAAGDTNAAHTEAERARQMSEAMGYHWGQADAAEVMEALKH